MCSRCPSPTWLKWTQTGASWCHLRAPGPDPAQHFQRVGLEPRGCSCQIHSASPTHGTEAQPWKDPPRTSCTASLLPNSRQIKHSSLPEDQPWMREPSLYSCCSCCSCCSVDQVRLPEEQAHPSNSSSTADLVWRSLCMETSLFTFASWNDWFGSLFPSTLREPFHDEALPLVFLIPSIQPILN